MSEVQPNPSDSEPLEPSDAKPPAPSPEASDSIAPDAQPSASPAAVSASRPAPPSQPAAQRSLFTTVITGLQETWRKLRPLINRLWNSVRPLLEQLGKLWNRLVAQLHARLPETWRSKLPQPVLSLVLAANLIFFVWVTSGIVNSSSATKPSQLPDQEANPAATVTASPLNTSSVAPEVAPPIATIEAPADLTPEQRLIAAIQEKITEVTQASADGLIQSVQANFRNHHLTVKLSQDWYTLAAPRQDELVNEILHRAQELEFDKLEVVDETDTRLARSPVVGSEMIVLARRLA